MKESDIIEVLLDCDAYFFFRFLVDDDDVQHLSSKCSIFKDSRGEEGWRNERKTENKTTKMAHWQLTIIDFSLLPACCQLSSRFFPHLTNITLTTRARAGKRTKNKLYRYFFFGGAVFVMSKKCCMFKRVTTRLACFVYFD